MQIVGGSVSSANANANGSGSGSGSGSGVSRGGGGGGGGGGSDGSGRSGAFAGGVRRDGDPNGSDEAQPPRVVLLDVTVDESNYEVIELRQPSTSDPDHPDSDPDPDPGPNYDSRRAADTSECITGDWSLEAALRGSLGDVGRS